MLSFQRSSCLFNRWVIFGVIAFFTLGVGWGFYSSRHSLLEGQKSTLTLICPKAWLAGSIAEDIGRDLKVEIKQLDYENSADFVHWMANAQGSADVICFHSFLAKDLIQSKFIDRADLKSLPSAQQISVDFNDLPFDPDFSFTLPLFWGVNGFVVREGSANTWKSIWSATGIKMALLFPDLELLWRMGLAGLELHEDEVEDEGRKLQGFVGTFMKSVTSLSSNRSEVSPENLKKLDYMQLSSGPAAVFLKSHPEWKYWLPPDGVSLWFGLVGVGANSENRVLAKQFIDRLIGPDAALAIHRMTNHGVVQASLDGSDQILPMQKARYIREVPLDRIRFPALSMEILPRWERLVTEAKH